MGQPIDTLRLPSGYHIDVHAGIDVPGWDEYVAAHESGHHAQSTSWARFQATRGWLPIRLAAREGEQMVGVAQVLHHRRWFTGTLGYLDHGPLVDEHRPGLVAAMVEGLQRFADSRLRMLLVQPATDRFAIEMSTAGFSGADPRIRSPCTLQIDLSRSEEELLAGMKRTTRANVRRGLRSGLEVRTATSADVAAFHDLLLKTAQRQHFTPNSQAFFAGLLREMPNESMLLLAEDSSGPVAGICLVGFGSRVVCKRAAWSGESGSLRPNELLHWSGMLWAKDAGYRFYDFDGIDPHVARTLASGGSIRGNAVESVTRFKLGFGGDVLVAPPAVGYVPNRAFRFGYDNVFGPLRQTRVARHLLRRLQTG
jgi:lipid II:glycine glycyltransferase (peptidoglycan interpeptide bridge formation enzyme)